MVNDLTQSEPRVLYVADGRDGAALDGYVDAVGEAGCEHIEMVAMDMWPAYIRSVREHTDALIAFDTFHVAQHLGAAGDQVRRQEHRALRQQGDDRLAKTRDLWLTRRGNMTQRQRRAFTPYGAPRFLGHGIRENPMSKEVGGMVGSKKVKGAVSARTEGARRASGVGADGAAVGAGGLAPGQRWSASRKRDVVLRLLRGESLDAVSREVGVELYRLEAWQARALGGLERGLKAQAGEPLAAELDAAKRHIGELSMENELLRERARAAERRLPLATRRSRR